MKKTFVKSAILAAVASLTFAPFVSAHHMANIENMPDGQWDIIDDQISDMHNEIIDAMNEEDDLMGSISRGMDGGAPTMGMGDGANSNQSTAQAAAQVISAPGRGMNNAIRRSGR